MIPFPSQTEFRGAMTNMTAFMMCRAFKTEIQYEVFSLISEDEKSDIKYSRYNENVVEKLVELGAEKFASYNSVEALFCAAMSVGTIIKEYEWGIQFVVGDGCYQLARRIYDATMNL